MFTGSYTALITPFRDGAIDLPALQRLVDFQCNSGVDGLVVCGSTGEAFTLSQAEHKEVVQTSVNAARGRIPIIVGVGHFTTHHTIELSKQSQDIGAQGLLIVTPPYLKPSGNALYLHYKTIHDQTNLPIILYDNPERGSVVIPNDVVIKLSHLSRIVGLKDASGDLIRPTILRQKILDNFVLLSGDDSTTLAFLAQGGDGVVSVTANVVPHLINLQIKAWQNGNLKRASDLRDQLMALHQALFCEPSPAATKYACSTLDLCRDEVRLPLVPLSQSARGQVDIILNTLSNV